MMYGPEGIQTNTNVSFWDKVSIYGEDDCWPWSEGLWHNGYGRYKENYISYRAHRYALEQKEPIPFPSAMALHTCHNRKCCNPKHLFWGTHQQNMEMRAARKIFAHNRGKILVNGSFV